VNDRLTADVTWKSSNPSVVRVSSDGRIAAIAPGRSNDTASRNAASATLP